MNKKEKAKILSQVEYTQYLQCITDIKKTTTYWFNAGMAWGTYQLAKMLAIPDTELMEAEQRGKELAKKSLEAEK